MKKTGILFTAIALVFFSCQKEENTNTSTYVPMKVGNYWVYQIYDIDSLNQATATNVFDSVIITKDTLINRSTYYKFEGTRHPYHGGNWHTLGYYRDSSGYLVDQTGRIYFSNHNFDDILYSYTQEGGMSDTIYSVGWKMEKPDENVTVPAGSFEVLDFQGTYIFSPAYIVQTNPRISDQYYAKNVGKIVETYFWIGSPGKVQRWLVRYNIEE